jgi:hypothetical protein
MGRDQLLPNDHVLEIIWNNVLFDFIHQNSLITGAVTLEWISVSHKDASELSLSYCKSLERVLDFSRFSQACIEILDSEPAPFPGE